MESIFGKIWGIKDSEQIFNHEQSEYEVQQGASEKDENKNTNTLGCLTKKFQNLIKSSPNQTIQIEKASQILNIQKRRIYDITNVLEGIGYIQKLGKNQMKWVGGVHNNQLQQKKQQIENQLDNLSKSVLKIQRQIQQYKQKINKLNENPELSYILSQDIMLIMKNMKLNKMLLFCGGSGDNIRHQFEDIKNNRCIIETKNQKSKIICINSNFKNNENQQQL